MSYFDIISEIFLSVSLSVIIISFLIPFLEKYALDKPNERSSHFKSKPTAGGISFVVIGTLFLAIRGNYYPLLCLPLAIIGFLDDFIKLNRKSRFSIQFLTVILLLSHAHFFDYFFNEYNALFKIVLTLFIIFFFLAIINFINFMDGLDGLLAGSMIVVLFTGSTLISNTYWPLLGLRYTALIQL